MKKTIIMMLVFLLSVSMAACSDSLENSQSVSVLEFSESASVTTEQDERESENTSTNEVNDENSSMRTGYAAPTALGDDWEAFVVQYGGDLYALPAPVSTFEANGWTVLPDNEQDVEGYGDGWVTLTKNEQSLRTCAKNYSGDSTDINNCYVTSVVSDRENETSITVAGGITIGASANELEAAIKGLPVEEVGMNSFYSYEVYPIEDMPYSYLFYLDKQDWEVYCIVVTYDPPDLRYTAENCSS